MVLLLVSLLAHADIPPPRGYVETCTVEHHQKDDLECRSCEGYHGGREPCEALEAEGFAKACQTYGASVWTEVLCRTASGEPAPNAPTPTEPEPAPSPEEPAPAKKERRCDVSGGAALGLAWLVAPVALVRRRR